MIKKWLVREQAPQEFVKTYADLDPTVVQLLYNRNLRTKPEIDEFLNPSQSEYEHDPLLFKDMAAAVEKTILFIKERKKIAICGDYDADGVSSSAILSETLKKLGAIVEVWIPSRFGQGYGLSNAIIDDLKAKDFSLIITVDNGIRSKNEAEYALSLGMEMIVTDHHEGPPTQAEEPQCLLIDPILSHETYPFKYLCGAGVAYKFATALINASTLESEKKAELKSSVIDLAAIGTIADCVQLLGENRHLATKGLEQMNRRPRLGIRELAAVSNLTGELDSWNIAWQITPRLNVAGRLDHANAAYQLLVTKDPNEARSIAADLNQKNSERQTMTLNIVNEATAQIEKDQKDETLLIAISPNVRDESAQGWNEGVIGLAAGRIAEKYSRPCLVITRSEGKIKGSGRSIEQFNLVSALEAGKEHLDRYGGHKMACGFSMKALEDLDGFCDKARNLAKQELASVDLSPVLKIDAAVAIESVNAEFINQVERFAPFGQDNNEPKFMSQVRIEELMVMGKDKTHLKLRVNGLWALAFRKAEEWGHLQVGTMVDLAYTVCFNDFNGRREPQLKIIDLKTI